MRKINKIIIHAADTFPDMDIGAKEIRKWHTDPKPDGNGWSDIGYHYVIRRDGTVELGRREEIPGAHVYGHNHDSIGICLVGGKPAIAGGVSCNYTLRQWVSLQDLVSNLEGRYPHAEVVGHNNFTNAKTCPNFDVKAWWYG